MDKSKKRKVWEEHRGFNSAWLELYAFTANDAGLPVCLICGEKLSKVLQPLRIGGETRKRKTADDLHHNSISQLFRVQL